MMVNNDFSKWLTCLFWAAGFTLLSAQSPNPPKTALLIAVGNYPPETGWQKINSANDVSLIKEALQKQGFQENEITVLLEEDATKEGIVNAIKKHLIAKSQRGGAAYFHFSGHGQQVFDDNGDEDDGYDEAIVPINSPMKYEKGVYEGQNLIRDDELGSLFNEARRKLGPSGSLQVVIDACHSGTGTRGFGIARGTPTKMADTTYVEGNRSRGSDQVTLEMAAPADERNMAPMIAFFGAAHNQLNFETTDDQGRGVGSLSYAFSKKFSAATPKTTYRGLFEQVKLEMSAIAPRQQPQAEGNLDQEIMGGKIVGPPSYFNVKNWNDRGSVTIAAGWLQGINEGAVIGFYPPETRSASTGKLITKGTVIRSEAIFSIVELEADMEEDKAMESWAFMLEQSFGDLSISLKMDLPPDHPLTPVLNERLKKLPVKLSEQTPDLHITTGNATSRGGAVQLITKDDNVLGTYTEAQRAEMVAGRIIDQIKNFGQAKFLKNMEMESSDIPVEFEMIPVKIDRRTLKELEEYPLSGKMDAAGNVHIQQGDAIKIKVTNNGFKTAFFTLLDIQPDNVVNVLLPGKNETPAEFQVAPGQSITVKRYFEIGPPAGTEVFKLIATDEPIDLRPVINTRGSGTKEPSQKPFEKLFGQTFFNDETSTRGGKAMSLGAAQVHIYSKTFIID